jgi:Ala-tRNA(Pro) deacylase
VFPGLEGVLGAEQVRLADEEELRTLFKDCELGAEPPLPHWKGVRLFVDKSLAEAERILFPAGTHEDGIRMAYADWARLASPKVAEFSAPLESAPR